MTTVTATHPTITVAAPPLVTPLSGRTLAMAVAAASDAIAWIPLDDPRWETVGPLLTAFVDAARRAHGLPGSPIRPDETVAPVLRLRDLGRLAQITAASAGTPKVAATTEISELLWSLQVAAL